MEWTTATGILAGLIDGDSDEAIAVIVAALPAYCGEAGAECTQDDWVQEGTWEGNETPAQIRAEWEAYIASDEDAD